MLHLSLASPDSSSTGQKHHFPTAFLLPTIVQVMYHHLQLCKWILHNCRELCTSWSCYHYCKYFMTNSCEVTWNSGAFSNLHRVAILASRGRPWGAFRASLCSRHCKPRGFPDGLPQKRRTIKTEAKMEEQLDFLTLHISMGSGKVWRKMSGFLAIDCQVIR